MLPALLFPQFDPVLVRLGPIAIHWYALAYIAGILLGWRYAMRLGGRSTPAIDPRLFDDFVVWATLGPVLGGRLGYVLFYKPGYYLSHPLEIPAVWQGGMAFHGGALGVIIATILFCRQRKIPLLAFGDIIACVAPIGLFFGRLANFVNGELWGRVTDVPWGMIFPHAGTEPRHPSQLYQAGLEGIVLFTLLLVLERKGLRQRPGVLTGTFLVGYGCARIIGEFFRQPDAFLGFLFAGATMGQLLSLPMVAIGVWLILRARSSASA